MGKIRKAASPKHEATISPALSEFRTKAANLPLIELPSHLDSFPRRWDFPRGDLYHWITPLNRFDDILQNFIVLYGLQDRPQTRNIGNSQLFQGRNGVKDPTRLRSLGFGEDGDRRLVESVLDFSRLLLEKCGNRSLYNSGERLNALLNTTSLSLLHSTLRLALCLAQRYHARHRPTHLNPGSLSAHYGLDLDRIQNLAAPFPMHQMPFRRSAPSSPEKSSEGREKPFPSSLGPNPNDLLSLSRVTSIENGAPALRSSIANSSGSGGWEECIKVQVLFQREDADESNDGVAAKGSESTGQGSSSTPSSTRRPSTNQASKLHRASTSDESHGESIPTAPAPTHPVSSLKQKFEPPLSTLLSSPIERVVAAGLSSVPRSSYYELLHKLRVAYALLGAVESRRELLAVRILAVSNLAYITSDSAFQQRFSTQDHERPRRQQFAFQLADLLHLGSREVWQVPLQLQTHVSNALRALNKQRSAVSDVNAALNIGANHGILLFVLRRAVEDLGIDGDASDNTCGDEWRESLFHLLHALLLSSTPPTRSGEVFASPQLVSAYVSILNLRSHKAQRIYVEVLHFFDSFFHHVKDGLAVLANNKAFDSVIDLLNQQVVEALDSCTRRAGYPAAYRTPSIDYKVSYTCQQTIRSILPFINGVTTQQGPQADRVLRSLIDSPPLLTAFRLIVEDGSLFGAHIWSEVVKVMTTFLNNEPTSYTILAEAGLIRSFLESIVLQSLLPEDSVESDAVSTGDGPVASTSQGSGPEADVDIKKDDSASGSRSEDATCKPQFARQGILPAAEAIANISQAFSAICLTSAGSEFFQASGALEKFFEIFESPPHVKVMKDASFLQMLGNSFDEFVRHHPSLKPTIMSAILVMVARMRCLCRWKAWAVGAGVKLWIQNADGKLGIAGGSKALVREVLLQPQDCDSLEDEPRFLQLPNGKRLLASAKVTKDLPKEDLTGDTDQEGLTVPDYLTPVTSFLIGLFENPSLCTAFMDAGGAELVLDLPTLQSLPFDFCQSTYYGGLSHELAQVIHMMAETKPHLTIPILVDKALKASENLEPFIAYQPDGGTSFVDPLITLSNESLGESSKLRPEDGTFFVKNLVALHVLVNILAEVYSSAMYHARNREQPAPFFQVNLTDRYLEVCQRLGTLSAACHREDKILEKRTPLRWSDATRRYGLAREAESEVTESFPAEDANDIEGSENSFISQRQNQSQGQQSPTDSDIRKYERTAAFKNMKVISRLFSLLPEAITQLFSQLGHGLVGRKRLDTYQKQNTLSVGGAIASALIHQLDPPFLKSTEDESPQRRRDICFPYLVEVLKSCANVLFDFSTSPDHAHCLTAVVLPFYTQGGVQILRRLGEQFHQELRSGQVSSDTVETMAMANAGLKSVLSILEHLTSAKSVVESTQSNSLKVLERSKPHHFNPAQFLLELRLEALPLVRTIWASTYTEQASKVVLEKLIAILRHVLNGDQEHDADKEGLTTMTHTSSLPTKKFVANVDRWNTLKSKGYDQDLAYEALFRCNNHSAAAEEYCEMFVRNPKLTRHRLPSTEAHSPAPSTSRKSTPERGATGAEESGEGANPSTGLTTTLGDFGVDQSLLDLLGNFQQHEPPTADTVTDTDVQPSQLSAQTGAEDNDVNRMQGVENAGRETRGSEQRASSATINVASVRERMGQKPEATVITMNSQREQIRADLTERCLNIISSHYDVTWELSDLIKSATKRLQESESRLFRESACSLLVTSLVSLLSDLEADDLSETTRKKIPACAHFVALLIQDEDFYMECLPHLQESFDSLLKLFQVSGKESTTDASLSWTGQILLIIERMLSDDAEPMQITWTMPTSLDDALPEAAVAADKTVVTEEEKFRLFQSLLNVLPRIGKNKSLALSVVRVLAILTRERAIAIELGEKRNLQRLFVMIKQLANMANDRIHSSVMLILRHIIEDDATLRQIMRSEIVAHFESRSSRQIDTTTYVRSLYHLVLRSPEVFVQVTNERLKLQHFDKNQRPQILTLKPESPVPDVAQVRVEEQAPPASPSGTTGTISETKAPVEKSTGEISSGDVKGKASDIKPPVVEHQDGVIHFVLSQLLSYRDVDDKDVSGSADRQVTSPTDTANEIDMVDASAASSPRSEAPPPEKNDKPPFTAEDHPIYVYRCFLLQSLTELLHSYNRTKIEFINFSRKSDPLAATPSKPRSGVLNYLLNSLISLNQVELEDSTQFKKRSVTSEWAVKVIIALCSKTGEQGLGVGRERYANYPRVEDDDSEPNLTFVRRFVLEHSVKAFKDSSANEAPQTRYARMLSLASLFHQMLSKPSGNEGAAGSNNTSHKVLAKMMFEKNFISILTSSLAEIDLTFAGAKRVVKYILKPLHELTDTAVYLSLNSSSPVSSALGQSEEDAISSASSVSEAEDNREETPDLFRNSALGMLEPNREDASTSESEPEEDDDEMYDGEYADDMEFEEEVGPLTANDGEVVSDEDVEGGPGPGALEGLSGDAPMDIELVMDDVRIGMDTDDDDDDDDDDGDEDDEDEEGEEVDGNEGEEDDEDEEDDFLIDIDDISGGEINADDENESLAEDRGEWQSADDPVHDVGETDSQDDVDETMNAAPTGTEDVNNGSVNMTGQGSLNNLLHILGENPGAPHPPGMQIGELLEEDDIEHAMQDLQDEEDDDDNEDNLDENEDDLAYQTFNDMLNDSDAPWPWEEGGVGHIQRTHHHPSHHHHPHFRGAPGQYTSFMSRHITGHGLPVPAIHRSHRVAPPARPADNGANPLLQHPSSSTPAGTRQTPPMDFVHGFGPGFMGYLPSGPGPGLASGGMLDAIMDAMQRGDGRVEMIDPSGRVDIHVDTNPTRLNDVLIRPSFPSSPPRNMREDPQRTVVFSPLSTAFRWQEEARLLFGLSHVEKTQRVVNALLSVLVPPAIEEEKARLKKAEEDRKREEDERAERERKERQDMEEKKKQQEEEEEAEKEKAAVQAQAEAEHANSSVTGAEHQEGDGQSTPVDLEQIQEVRTSHSQENITNSEVIGNQSSVSAGPSENPPRRVFTTIRGRQLDITNMSIDAEYLEALPEELREEVIMQQYAEQRHQAEEQGQPPTDINREFLEALPEDIREELLQQEATERRRRERDAARRRAAESGGPPRAEEMDADSFMATLDPALRRSILADQSDEVLNALAPEYAAEARAIVNRQLQHLGGRMPVGRDVREERAGRDAVSGQKDQRKQVVQMVDRAGVATLMRLMFMQQQGSASNNLHTILHNVCQHRQTRAEVISLLLSILQDGSADVSAVEKSLAHLSLRAKTSPAQKSPPALKRTLSTQAANVPATEMTPLMVVQQCLAALASLTHYDAHVASVFLRELEASTSNKSRVNRKGKSRENRANKFAINALIGLLDRRLITENAACMESLSSLLATISHPLTWVLKKDKGKPVPPEVQKQDESSAAGERGTGESGPGNTRDAPDVAAENSQQSQVSGIADTPMLDESGAAAAIPAESTALEPSESVSKDQTSTDRPQASDDGKSRKAVEPPVIPEQNFRLIVGVLAARECNGKTFRDTLSTINALSLIPGAKEVFGQELVSQSQHLSQAIFADLNDLLGSISEASSGTDIQGLATARFSPASADQAKLLRVLTALDYLFDPKRPDNGDDTSPRLHDVLTSLYETATFSTLWTKLSECLSAIHRRDGMLSVATVLLPLIEALMVVCKNTSLKDTPISYRLREQSTASPGPETGMERLFFAFTTEHRKILNELVRQNPKLMNGIFSLLAKNPKVLEFDNKRTYFTRQIHSKNRDARQPQPPLQLSVRRDHVFLDSFKSLYFKSADEMKYGKLSIRFHGEEGVDAGGVTREWFQVLARGMFNPNYALFIPVASDRTTFHPNRLSGVNSEHLMFFKFIGRIIGKALYEGRVLDCHFSRAVYKKILGKTVSLKDMETLDLDYYKSLVWMLENDITDIITETFSIEANDFGEPQTIDLIENGRNIPVTEENKQEYIQLVVEYRLTGSVKEQLENFLKGFHDIVPAELVSIFTEQELELLISGLPDINVDDWKANTEYHTYNASSPAIQWFWRAVRSFDKEEQAKLLQFVTGTSKVPLNGFKELEGMNGFSRFNIHKDYGNSDRLPSSHTCFNQLDLPAYENYETLRQRLLTAMLQGSEYFGFA